MKIIKCDKRDKNHNIFTSINFIDESDVYVGYNMKIDCCEFSGYYFSNKPYDIDLMSVDFTKLIKQYGPTAKVLEKYRFDTKYISIRGISGKHGAGS
jgi:hypothetical protein